MKVILLYRPNSGHARQVEDFLRDFTKFHRDHSITLVSLDTRDGAALVDLHGVVRYPAILAMTNDGQLLRDWQGEVLPLMNEVASYAH